MNRSQFPRVPRTLAVLVLATSFADHAWAASIAVWGDNGYGQFGSGTTSAGSNVPVLSTSLSAPHASPVELDIEQSPIPPSLPIRAHSCPFVAKFISATKGHEGARRRFQSTNEHE